MKTATLNAVRKHGENLLAIFPNATERDPVKLCKKLRRLESEAHAFAMRCCNGPDWPSEEAQDEDAEAIMAKVGQLLQFQRPGVPVRINRDARGYALKISNEWLSEATESAFRAVGQFKRRCAGRTAAHNYHMALAGLHRDWGGYGIIAPDLTEGE